MPRESILVVDDEDTIQFVLASLLGQHGHEVRTAGSAEAALEQLAETEFSAALLDIVLPGMSGIALLERIRRTHPDTQVVMMTSHASAQTAIEALRNGAYDYVHKPFELDEVLSVVERAVERRRLTLHNRRLVEEQARQNAELRGAVRRLNSLNAAGVGMSGISTLPDLLDFFVGLVERELDAERVSLMLLDEDGALLRIAAARGLSEQVERETCVRLGEGIAGQVARDGRALLGAEDGRTAPIGAGGWPGAEGSFVSVPVTMAVPIRTPRDVLGVLNVTSPRDGRAFHPEDAAYLAALAGQAAVAIERARQSDRLKAAYETLQATQEQIVTAGRLKALGEMAAGIAHDFNNVLNGVLGRSQLLQHELRRPEPRLDRVAAWATLIEKLSMQGAQTVRRIQEFSLIRRDRPTQVVGLSDVANLAVALTEPKWQDEPRALGLTVTVVAELGDAPPVAGNLQDLGQAVSNLVFNAVEAMPKGGRITLRTYARDGSAVIEVEDDGIGMTPEARERLFEPFYTTKPGGQGLGMSVVYGIVRRFGGRLEVDSEPQRGSRIALVFPAAEGTPAADAPADAAGPGPRAVGRVLVIDDEPQNRDVCQECLEFAGHVVRAAASGQEGLALLQREPFDVVITDLSMPGLSGWDVARAIKRAHPRTKVMLLSGWGIQQEEASVRDAGVDLVVAKPVELGALTESVQQLMAA